MWDMPYLHKMLLLLANILLKAEIIELHVANGVVCMIGELLFSGCNSVLHSSYTLATLYTEAYVCYCHCQMKFKGPESDQEFYLGMTLTRNQRRFAS